MSVTLPAAPETPEPLATKTFTSLGAWVGIGKSSWVVVGATVVVGGGSASPPTACVEVGVMVPDTPSVPPAEPSSTAASAPPSTSGRSPGVSSRPFQSRTRPSTTATAMSRKARGAAAALLGPSPPPPRPTFIGCRLLQPPVARGGLADGDLAGVGGGEPRAGRSPWRRWYRVTRRAVGGSESPRAQTAPGSVRPSVRWPSTKTARSPGCRDPAVSVPRPDDPPPRGVVQVPPPHRSAYRGGSGDVPSPPQ